MSRITGNLRNKLELYGSTWIEDELGEESKVFSKLKDVYCQVIPTHGGVKSVGGTHTQEVYTMQTIKCRKLSVKNPTIDMFFKDASGLKYEVLDFYQDYKNSEFWEFRTRINYE